MLLRSFCRHSLLPASTCRTLLPTQDRNAEQTKISHWTLYPHQPCPDNLLWYASSS